MREPVVPWDPTNPYLTEKEYNQGIALYYAVPKNYKKARGIAAEEVYRQEAAKGFAELLYDIFSKLSKFGDRFTRDDQTMQQRLVELGSRYWIFGSIDLSSASDTVLWTQVETWFPSEVVRVMRTLRSNFVRMPDGKTRLVHMAFTSGHTLTFITESLVFGAILELSCSMNHIWPDRSALISADVLQGYNPWGIYGDDCAVVWTAWHTAVELLEHFGFKVNTSKSFLGKYTEACGDEYFEGREVSSNYWPRKTLVGLKDELSPNSLLSLIDLQHRLFSHKKAALFLAWYVRDFLTDITMSLPGTDCTDLWSNTPRVIRPTYSVEFVDGKWKEVKRDIHYVGHYVADIKSDKRPTADGDYVCTERIVRKSGYFREMHNGVSPDRARRLLDFKAYVDFLLDGPVYNTELDRLLGVSVKSDRYKALKLETVTFRPEFLA
jgi:hypothetical protein